ncbi:MAG: hypothetical protein EHM93_20040 [Bacteroidales bacterium]|nr:MAG: hypothetical protein EHM93_20040 [Bacteroidales bacterium]
MIRTLLLSLIVVFALTNVYGQNVPQTLAERTNYESTSSYNDVLNFIDQIKKSSKLVAVENIGQTIEGRDIPLLIVANPLPKSPTDLINDKRVVVYIQANIHPGEVEGKEASLMYIRDLLKDKNSEILKNAVLLVCPNLNADGNERYSTKNRTNQNGPKSVGVRYNAQMLDLNRDGMKVESPEMRGVIANVINRWDPDVIMDCHTTNGAYHVEPVTFTWMMNPNGDRALINYMRDKMMPKVSSVLLEKYKTENCFYGEFVDMGDYSKGWISYAAEPRYFTNYMGIRNRLSILNENYVYADFKSRVLGCYHLIHSLMDYSSANSAEIKSIVKDADAKTIAKGLNPSVADSFAITYEGRPTPNKVTIQTYEADKVVADNEWERYKKSDRRLDVTVDYIADYFATKNVKSPFAYILAIHDPAIINLLKLHGISVERLDKTISLEVDKFVIEELKATPRLNQGHYNETVKGRFVKETKEFGAGTCIIRTSQRLGNLISYLLEPQTDDGLLFWNYFDKYLVPQWSRTYNPYPVYRVIDRTEIRSTVEK